MSFAHHSINYLELTVTDLAAAKAFYGEAFGWQFVDYGPGYSGILAVPDQQTSSGESYEVGGLAEAEDPPQSGGPFVILFSHDLEASQRAVETAGGTITVAPYAFPGGKRFHFADPSGNELGVWALPE